MMNLGLMDPAFLGSLTSYDPDAAAYISTVEAADGQALETGVKDAINAFVLGCKTDGIWNAIKASCILAGARTLAGALVPLVGTAPTNFNFVSGDYNRKTGLVGDGSTKYLDSNRNNNADPQNSKHLAVWRSAFTNQFGGSGGILGSNGTATGHSHLYEGFGAFITRNNSVIADDTPLESSPTFYGTSRSSSSEFKTRVKSTNYTKSSTSETPASTSILLFKTAGYSDSRIAFYSIGESLNLALLDTRVTALVNAIAAAIP